MKLDAYDMRQAIAERNKARYSRGRCVMIEC